MGTRNRSADDRTMESSSDFFLALPAVVAHRPHRGFEVGRRLLLDLVREVVNFEPVQPESGQQTK